MTSGPSLITARLFVNDSMTARAPAKPILCERSDDLACSGEDTEFLDDDSSDSEWSNRSFEIRRVEEIKNKRFTCDVCCAESRSDTSVVKVDLKCGHSCCRDCLQKAVMIDQYRCPSCREELTDLEILRGTTNVNEWIDREKERAWAQGGHTGFRCHSDTCVGIVQQGLTAGEARGAAARFEVACPHEECQFTYCGRCRCRWNEGHECDDIRQQRQQHEQRVRQHWTTLLRWCLILLCLLAFGNFFAKLGLPTTNLVINAVGPVVFAMQQWRRRPQVRAEWAVTDAVKPCPGCDHPTEKVNGCNIISCTICRKHWCFVCGRGEEHGCLHGRCLSKSST